MEYQPINGRQFPRFSAIKTFFRLPIANIDDGYDVGIFGVPFDGGVSYRPGARFAPSEVRKASSLGRGYHWQRETNVFSHLKVADLGDCPTNPLELLKSHQLIEDFASQVLSRNKKFLAVGGDHSITLALLRAQKKHRGKPCAFVHFDAHLDTYPAAFGNEYHHGAFARHAVEEGLVDPKLMVQIGIRGPLVSQEDLDFVKKYSIKVITIDDIRLKGLDACLKLIPDFGAAPTYFSFDVDCLDPAYAPGTGTPVVGGMTTFEAQYFLRKIPVNNFIGGDVVEISPPYDHADITSLVGVDVLFEYMHLFKTAPK